VTLPGDEDRPTVWGEEDSGEVEKLPLVPILIPTSSSDVEWVVEPRAVKTALPYLIGAAVAAIIWAMW
jgi:hypothetical protein